MAIAIFHVARFEAAMEMEEEKLIQIDEAALREGLPLRKSEHAFYLDWAVHSFHITNVGVKDTTQVVGGIAESSLYGNQPQILLSPKGTYRSLSKLALALKKIVNVPKPKSINILAIVIGLLIAQMEMKREGINNKALDDVIPLAWEAPLAVCAAANSVGRREVLKRLIENSAGRRGVTLRRPIARMQAQFGDIAGLNT